MTARFCSNTSAQRFGDFDCLWMWAVGILVLCGPIDFDLFVYEDKKENSGSIILTTHQLLTIHMSSPLINCCISYNPFIHSAKRHEGDPGRFREWRLHSEQWRGLRGMRRVMQVAPVPNPKIYKYIYIYIIYIYVIYIYICNIYICNIYICNIYIYM